MKEYSVSLYFFSNLPGRIIVASRELRQPSVLLIYNSSNDNPSRTPEQRAVRYGQIEQVISRIADGTWREANVLLTSNYDLDYAHDELHDMLQQLSDKDFAVLYNLGAAQ